MPSIGSTPVLLHPNLPPSNTLICFAINLHPSFSKTIKNHKHIKGAFSALMMMTLMMIGVKFSQHIAPDFPHVSQC